MRALEAALHVPWAMRPETLRMLLQIAAREHDVDFATAARRLAARFNEIDHAAVSVSPGKPLAGAKVARTRGSVAVLPIEGPIFRYANLFSSMSGATSIEELAADLHTAQHDPDVEAIVLHIDSPGGEVNGTAEFAELVRNAARDKNVVAYISNEGASAAYWIASATRRIVVAPTAIVGSIGVCAALPAPAPAPGAGRGERIEFVSSQSPRKRPDLNTPEGRSQVQRVVDDLADQFIEAVARYRGVSTERVLTDFGNGDVLVGAKAVTAGLADEVGTFESVLSSLVGQQAPEPSKRVPASRVAASVSESVALTEVGAAEARQAQPDQSPEPESPGCASPTGSGALDEPTFTASAGPLPPHQSRSVAAHDAAWDPAAEVANATSPRQLERMHAWRQDEGDPASASSYELAHHRADGTLVPRGLRQCGQQMQQLDQEDAPSASARRIPHHHRKGVKAHLEEHYHVLGMYAPWEPDPDHDNDIDPPGQPDTDDAPPASAPAAPAASSPTSGGAAPATAASTDRSQDVSGWKDRLLAVVREIPDSEAGEASAAAPVVAGALSATSTSASDELAQLRAQIRARDDELARQREANRRLAAERIRERAEAFADKIITVDRKAFPSQRAQIMGQYVQAATDDSLVPVDGGESRVELLARLFDSAPKHLLDEESIPSALQHLSAIANVVDTPRATEHGQPMSAERREQLLKLTAAGRDVLAERNGGNGSGKGSYGTGRRN